MLPSGGKHEVEAAVVLGLHRTVVAHLPAGVTMTIAAIACPTAAGSSALCGARTRAQGPCPCSERNRACSAGHWLGRVGLPVQMAARTGCTCVPDWCGVVCGSNPRGAFNMA